MDAANTRGRHDDGLGTFAGKETAHVGLIGEVELGMRPYQQFAVTAFVQGSDNGRADQSPMAGNINSRGWSQLHIYSWWL